MAGLVSVIPPLEKPQNAAVGFTTIINSAGQELGMSIPAISTATFARPADTTAYTTLDLIANSTTAASVVPLSFTLLGLGNDRPVSIRRARIVLDGTVVTNSTFRLWLFKTLPTVATAGDNSALASDVSGAAGFIGTMTNGTACLGMVDGICGVMTPEFGSEINAFPVAGTSTLYGLLQAVGAYTPTSAENITITLELFQE